jgi:hypothetical protein
MKKSDRFQVRALVLCAIAAIAAAISFCGVAHAGALDERAPVAVQASPREVYALRLILGQQSFKGDDQDAESRVAEAFDFAAVDARAKAVTKAKLATPDCRAAGGRGPSCEANGEDFSDKRAARSIPKDDAARVVEWVRAASMPGIFNEILAPLVRELRRAAGR